MCPILILIFFFVYVFLFLHFIEIILLAHNYGLRYVQIPLTTPPTQVDKTTDPRCYLSIQEAVRCYLSKEEVTRCYLSIQEAIRCYLPTEEVIKLQGATRGSE